MKKVIPFSNASEFEYWEARNCQRCSKYDNTSTERNTAGCVMSFDLELSMVSDGLIFQSSFEIMGIKNNTGCKLINRGLFVPKINTGVFDQKQLKLF